MSDIGEWYRAHAFSYNVITQLCRSYQFTGKWDNFEKLNTPDTLDRDGIIRK